LRDRDAASLSGGERQRCAIAGALAAAPAILVLDEPTSQLDPQGADDVLAALTRLNHDLGTTVVLAEHRLDRAAPLADRAVIVECGAVIADGDPGTTLAHYPGAPSVTRLGAVFGWDPPPLTVKAARALATRLDRAAPTVTDPSEPTAGDELVSVAGVTVRHRTGTALRDVSCAVRAGEVVALLGRNGAGKSTLLRVLAGLQNPTDGTRNARDRVAYVPQEPGSLFSAATVAEEIAATITLLRRDDPDAVELWIDRMHLRHVHDRHPRSLSGGERQRLAVAAVAVGGAPVLLLDEPTRGMDAQSRAVLEAAAHDHTRSGGAVVLATHDVELAARVATRVVVVGDGEIVADGPARTVLAGSLFAPQVLRVVPPLLTVAEAEAWWRV
jgi:energy-coupling factor transport system ATP-binding protein